MDGIYGIAGLLFSGSLIGFIVGFIMILSKDNRKQGLKILLYSIIGMIIGFGTCTINF